MAYVDSGYLITDTQTSDLEPVELETVSTLPSNTTADVTVYQDTDSDGTAENSRTVTVTGGTETYDLDSFAVGGDVWLRIDLGTSDTDVTPEFDAATVEVASPPPSNLSATASNLREVSLDWDDVSTADEYNVYRDTTSGAVDSGDLIGTVTTTTYTDTDSSLLDGRQYYYAVTSVTDGVESNDATETSVITQLPPAESLAVDSTSGRFATLSWTDPSNNADHFEVLLREDDEGLYGIDGETGSTTYETTELLDGQQYGATVEMWTADAVAREGTNSDGWWTMDDRHISGDVAHDISGQSRNGDIVNAVTGSDGVYGQAVDFIGDDSAYIQTPHSGNYGTGPFTVAFWVYWDSFGSYDTVASTYDGSGGWICGVDGSSQWRFWVGGDDLSGGSVPTGEWVHYIARRDSNGNKDLYIDLNSVASGTSTVDVDSPEPVHLGRRPSGSNPAEVRLDDVRIYDWGLSASERETVYNGGIL